MSAERRPLTWQDIRDWLTAQGYTGPNPFEVAFIAPAVNERGEVYLTISARARDVDGRHVVDMQTGRPVVNVVTLPLYALPGVPA